MDYPKDDYETRNPKKNKKRKSKYEELEESSYICLTFSISLLNIFIFSS